MEIKRDEAGLGTPLVYHGQIVLNMSVCRGMDHPSADAAGIFADLVKEKTGGRIRVVLNFRQEEDREEQAVKEVEYGSADLAQVSAGALTEYCQALTVFQMPFLFYGREHMWRVLDGEVGAVFLEGMKESGIEGLCWYDAGARNLYLMKEAKNWRALESRRIQVEGSAFMMDVVSSMGALPMDLSSGDAVEALRKSQIDGVESDLEGYDMGGYDSFAVWELSTEHVRVPDVVVMNQHSLEQLEEADQRIIRDAARESSIRQRERWTEYEKHLYERMETEGLQRRSLDDWEGFCRKTETVYEIYGQPYREIIERIRAMAPKK
ncbi:MAG: TRAP transporter substrate-binding protein DctP [Eubacteriales bacterium]|nr:TRAP transporter substrate-binding protein DctP [Eubacteriales bacterium]